MYPFFETIRYDNGVLENLSYHQKRVDRCFAAFGATSSIRLTDIVFPLHLIKDQLYKCRVKYNLEGATFIEWEPYTTRQIYTIAYVETNGYEYAHKYTDRTWLNNALKNAGTDEIILTDKGIIKDASYANLALYNGDQWHTPINPLLQGTKRAALIDQGILTEKEIHINDLAQYEQVKLINAMMTWEESPVVFI